MENSSELQLKQYSEILKKRQRQLKGDSFAPTLKKKCIEIIKSNADLYVELYDKTGVNPFEHLPNGLQPEILGYNTGRKWGKWQDMLLSKDQTKLKIEVNPQKDASSILHFALSLETKKPQIRKFSWDYLASDYKDEETLFPILIISSQCFLQLQNLSLGSFHCNDQHLQLIAAHLKQLKVLYLNLSNDVSLKGISALAALELLKIITFGCKSEDDEIAETKVLNLFLQLLPKLLHVGKIDAGFWEICHATADNDPQIDFQAIQAPIELGLQQLSLRTDLVTIPEAITFPNLTTLVLWRPGFVSLDSRFSKVNELGLMKLGMEECLRILNILGRQVRRLIFEEIKDEVKLDKIVRLCPKLEGLHMIRSPRRVSFDTSLEADVDLKSLRKLTLVNSSYHRTNIFSPGMLVQLLRAPNLCSLNLNNVDFTKEDTNVIVNLLQQGRMFQSLEKLEIDNVYISDKDEEWFDKEMRARYDTILNSIVQYCPSFVHLSEEC